VISGTQGTRLEDSSHERKPKIMTFLRIDLDDQQLKRLFRREYRGIRGISRSTFSRNQCFLVRQKVKACWKDEVEFKKLRFYVKWSRRAAFAGTLSETSSLVHAWVELDGSLDLVKLAHMILAVGLLGLNALHKLCGQKALVLSLSTKGSSWFGGENDLLSTKRIVICEFLYKVTLASNIISFSATDHFLRSIVS
jgi:hypothetical protein